jgi:signal peptidase I
MIGLIIKLSATCLNILMPGSGLIFTGHLRTAILVQISLIGLLVSLCWSRLILSPVGILILIFGSGLIYIVSTFLCFTRKIHYPETKRQWLWHRLGASILLVMFGIALIIGGFFTKQHWLGIHIYFVPSMSMYPTLKSGQFILLDTWAYWYKEPEIDDIVVFKPDNPDKWFVKRIAQWPNGEIVNDGLFYLLGDNRKYSFDSRSFGGIEHEQIIGKVKLVLLRIDRNYRLLDSRFLQPVN